MQLLMGMRKSLSLLLEQPSGSWAMKLRFMMSLALSLKLYRMTTWMGLYNHDLPKCSHLWSNHRPTKTKKNKWSHSAALKTPGSKDFSTI